MLRLAAPVVLAELGWMTMGIVDTVMVGRVGPEAIGAVGVGNSLFMGVVIFAMGLMLGLDTLVSRAFGAGEVEDCHRWLLHGVTLALVLSVPFMMILFALSGALQQWRLTPAVVNLTRPYLDALTWSVPLLLLYSAFRRYLQGMGVVRPIMVALISANVINAVFNWMLIFGRLGAPAMGVRGSAWATVFARGMMAALLLGVIVRREWRRSPGLFQTPLRIERARMVRLIGLGLPAASQVTLEIGVFATATVLAGRLPAVALAAHQIAINIAAFTFMVPLGVGSAGAVRVGQAIGRRDPAGASRSGWTALVLGGGFMACSAACFLLLPGLLIGVFTTERTGGRRGCLAAHGWGGLPVVRRCPDGGDRRSARAGRHPDAHGLESCRTLVRRSSTRVSPVFPGRHGRGGPVVGVVQRPDHLRRGPPAGLVGTHRGGIPLAAAVRQEGAFNG